MKNPFKRDRRLKNERPTSEICAKDGIQNAAQTLLANIRFSSVDEPMRVLAITSSIPNEGKTTVALSLAMSISNSGAKCLIVEGDMRRRSMRSLLGAQTRYGLHRLLTGKCAFDEAIVSTDYDNIFFLDAEQGIPNPDAILSSGQFQKMLESLTKHYHYILVDTPPVSAFADASIIASRVDGVLLVTREGYTNKNEVVRAAEQLRKTGANIVGIVLNGHQAKSGGGYGGYYYDYYYDYYSEDDDQAPKTSSAGAALSKLREKVSSDSSATNQNTSFDEDENQTVRPVSALRNSSSRAAHAGSGCSSKGSSDRWATFGKVNQTNASSGSTVEQTDASAAAVEATASASGRRVDDEGVQTAVSKSSGYKVPILNQAAADRVRSEAAARRAEAQASLDTE